MTTEMIDVIKVVVFALVGGGSFIAGYLLRYLFSTDYEAGYCKGYEDGRRIQKELHQLGINE